MSLGTLLLIVLIVVLLGGVAPIWPYSHNWGPYPSSGLGLVLIIVIILLILRR